MAKPESSDKRKYIFRLITRSHPWGYQRRDNTKTLESHHKNEMLEKVYGNDDKKNLWKDKTMSSVKTKIGRGQTNDWIYSQFTLISIDENSIKTLVHEIADWLKKFQEDAPSGHNLTSINLQEAFLKDISEDYHTSNS